MSHSCLYSSLSGDGKPKAGHSPSTTRPGQELSVQVEGRGSRLHSPHGPQTVDNKPGRYPQHKESHDRRHNTQGGRDASNNANNNIYANYNCGDGGGYQTPMMTSGIMTPGMMTPRVIAPGMMSGYYPTPYYGRSGHCGKVRTVNKIHLEQSKNVKIKECKNPCKCHTKQSCQHDTFVHQKYRSHSNKKHKTFVKQHPLIQAGSFSRIKIGK